MAKVYKESLRGASQWEILSRVTPICNTYMSYEIEESDTRAERMKKLYLGIISVGEDLYCKGAHLSEIQKQINGLERQVADMRKELAELKGIQ